LKYTIQTLKEIHNQPSAWHECIQLLQSSDLKRLVRGRHPEQAEWVFVGCGTSYYLAQAAAASFVLLTGRVARAVPASEILLHADLALPNVAHVFPVLISRSGHTSEVLAVAASLKERGVEFLALTCDGNEVALASDRVLQLPVKEESTVMTSSFTSMLLAMQFLAASLAGNAELLEGLRQLPFAVQRLIEKYEPQVEAFASRRFADLAVLGQGALYPVASEFALKVMESSSSYAQFFHTLEFRHGPKSIVSDEVLVAGLISEEGYGQECKVIGEMKDLGASTFVVTNTATPALRAVSDLLIELSLPGPALSRLCAYIVWGQLFGSYVSLAKGMNPDAPRNLSRVVTL